jgi:hypothetical protein
MGELNHNTPNYGTRIMGEISYRKIGINSYTQRTPYILWFGSNHVLALDKIITGLMRIAYNPNSPPSSQSLIKSGEMNYSV